MRGAGRLAAVAALRAGAGLCTLAADGDARGELDAPDSVMTRSALAGRPDRAAARRQGRRGDRPRAGPDAERRRAGPRGARGRRARRCSTPTRSTCSPPIRRAIAGAAGPVVITPHPGEASRLLGTTAAEIEADRLAAARALAARTRAVVVLKGARTLVCDGTGDDALCSINPTGGPALATGGSGDVLAGAIGALLAQGLSAGDAARAGVVRPRRGRRCAGAGARRSRRRVLGSARRDRGGDPVAGDPAIAGHSEPGREIRRDGAHGAGQPGRWTAGRRERRFPHGWERRFSCSA